MRETQRAYTDYPILELGDEPQQRAPIRQVNIVAYDGNKYATIEVTEGERTVTTEIKAGYLYKNARRYGDPDVIHVKLRELPPN